MARSVATSERLRALSIEFKEHYNSILSFEQAMNTKLNSFVWIDVVGLAFKRDYEDKMSIIHNELAPDLLAYSEYLQKQADIIDEFNQGKL